MLRSDEFARIVHGFGLSPREAEFLDHAVVDSRDSVIADRMGLSVHTAHSHRRRLFQKLGVEDMPSALSVVFARSLELRGGVDAS